MEKNWFDFYTNLLIAAFSKTKKNGFFKLRGLKYTIASQWTPPTLHSYRAIIDSKKKLKKEFYFMYKNWEKRKRMGKKVSKKILRKKTVRRKYCIHVCGRYKNTNMYFYYEDCLKGRKKGFSTRIVNVPKEIFVPTAGGASTRRRRKQRNRRGMSPGVVGGGHRRGRTSSTASIAAVCWVTMPYGVHCPATTTKIRQLEMSVSNDAPHRKTSSLAAKINRNNCCARKVGFCGVAVRWCGAIACRAISLLLGENGWVRVSGTRVRHYMLAKVIRVHIRKR